MFTITLCSYFNDCMTFYKISLLFWKLIVFRLMIIYQKKNFIICKLRKYFSFWSTKKTFIFFLLKKSTSVWHFEHFMFVTISKQHILILAHTQTCKTMINAFNQTIQFYPTTQPNSQHNALHIYPKFHCSMNYSWCEDKEWLTCIIKPHIFHPCTNGNLQNNV